MESLARESGECCDPTKQKFSRTPAKRPPAFRPLLDREAFRGGVASVGRGDCDWASGGAAGNVGPHALAGCDHETCGWGSVEIDCCGA